MSRLEKFIEDNREDFDDVAPSDKLWQCLEAALTKKPVKRFQLHPVARWSAAAAVLALVIAAVFLMTNKNEPADALSTKDNHEPVRDTVSVAADEASEMNQFTKIILIKQEELKVLAKEQPVLYRKFAKDITQLDSLYNTLKNKLSVNPNREMLIEAMIQNLQLQMDVLNQQLNIIHQIKKSQKNNHEKNKAFT